MSTLIVHNAEITTATVEIRTLTISGKQVTLAVYRQLRQQPWLDREANALGDAWGHVNYHVDPRCKQPQSQGGLAGEFHLHLVWQRGSELRRALLRREHSFRDEIHELRWKAAWELAWSLPQLFIAV